MGLNGAADAAEVMRRRERLAAELGFDLGRAVLAVQVHGAQIGTFHRGAVAEGGQSILDTDALATDIPGQALLTFHADCFPLLFADGHTGAVAAAHAGWRGLLEGVARRTVKALADAYGSRPQDLIVLIGPGICQSCYEVGPDVALPMMKRYGSPERYLLSRGSKWLLDLAALARLQLEQADIPPQQIEETRWCTREDDRWFSHRAGRRGRFLSAIVA